MKFYVYKMIHLPSGRVYIGQRKLPKGKTPETDEYFGSGKIWKRIYEKYPDECVKVIIDSAETGEKADELEKFYIAHYKSVWGDKCVNIARGGYNLHEFKLNDEQKKQMSGRFKGEKNPFYGKHHTEETKQKISAAKRGKKHGPCSEETKRKLSEANKGQVPWITGKHHTDETKEKIRKGVTGFKHTEETKQKMSAAKRGKKHGPCSEETKEKLRLGNIGKKRSPEARKKCPKKLKEERFQKKHAKNYPKRRSCNGEKRRVSNETLLKFYVLT